MRVAVAKLLIRLAVRVLQGPDDRVVLLNTKRHRARPGSPDAGRVHAFITVEDEPKVAATFRPDKVPRGLGLPFPAWVARLAGYDLYHIG